MRKVIGIDLGGTKIACGLVDFNGNILKKLKCKTEADKGREAVLENIYGLVDKLFSDDVEGIAIVTPGFIDSKNGIVKFAGNIKGWTGVNLMDLLSKRYNRKISVQNDANVAALCEKWIGAASDFSSFVMLTLGTGLGGAVYLENYGFIEGERFQGSELGHMILYPNGRLCTCKQKGCAERYIAGSALSTNYFELTKNKITGPEIISRLNTDEWARLALDKFADDLALFLVSLTNAYDPKGFVIGGGFIKTRDFWWEIMIEKYLTYCNRPENILIVPAKFENDAGIIGAAKSIIDKLEV